MAAGNPWTIEDGGGPVVACAIHAGSDVRAEVLRHMAVRRRQRVYEEDPYTDQLTAVAGTSVVVHRSRFEFDLNRSRERDRKSTRLNSSHPSISYAVFCLKKKK